MAELMQVKDRISFFYAEHGSLTVESACLVLWDSRAGLTYEVPARMTATILVGPGMTVSSEAVRLAGAYGVLLVWVGEQGVRTYSAGTAWGETTEWLDRQVLAYASPEVTLQVVHRMFQQRFGTAVRGRSVDQLRGIEGARVRETYKILAQQYRVPWEGRRYVPGNPDGQTDAINVAINVANTCLYGLAEVAVRALGLHPALGFLHRGRQSSFVLDVADLYKMTVTVPLAFKVVAQAGAPRAPWDLLERDVRWATRDLFRANRLVERFVPDIQSLFPAPQA